MESNAPMHLFNMLMQVALLVEVMATLWHWTNVGFFSAVDSKVSIKFGQASEDFVAGSSF